MKKIVLAILMLAGTVSIFAPPHAHSHKAPKNCDEALDFVIDLFTEKDFRICRSFKAYCCELAPLLMLHPDERVQALGADLQNLSELGIRALADRLSKFQAKYQELFAEYMAQRARNWLPESILKNRMMQAIAFRG